MGIPLVLSQPILWSHRPCAGHHPDFCSAEVCCTYSLRPPAILPPNPSDHNANHCWMYVAHITAMSRIRRNLTLDRTVTFIARTYALYNRSRAVLVGLTSLAFTAIAVGGVSHDRRKYAIHSLNQVIWSSGWCPGGENWPSVQGFPRGLLAARQVSHGLSKPIEHFLCPSSHPQPLGPGVSTAVLSTFRSLCLWLRPRSGVGLVRRHGLRSRCGRNDTREDDTNQPEERERPHTHPHTDTRW